MLCVCINYIKNYSLLYYKDMEEAFRGRKVCSAFLSGLGIQAFVSFCYCRVCDHHETVLAQSRMWKALLGDTNPLPHIHILLGSL